MSLAVHRRPRRLFDLVYWQAVVPVAAVLAVGVTALVVRGEAKRTAVPPAAAPIPPVVAHAPPPTPPAPAVATFKPIAPAVAAPEVVPAPREFVAVVPPEAAPEPRLSSPPDVLALRPPAPPPPVIEPPAVPERIREILRAKEAAQAPARKGGQKAGWKEIDWQPTVAAAFQKAKADNKPILVYTYTYSGGPQAAAVTFQRTGTVDRDGPVCGGSQQYRDSILSERAVVDAINEGFVAVRVNVGVDGLPKLAAYKKLPEGYKNMALNTAALAALDAFSPHGDVPLGSSGNTVLSPVAAFRFTDPAEKTLEFLKDCVDRFEEAELVRKDKTLSEPKKFAHLRDLSKAAMEPLFAAEGNPRKAFLRVGK